jgi:hypothetical protein
MEIIWEKIGKTWLLKKIRKKPVNNFKKKWVSEK